jgi:hypothetical protein
MSHSLTTIHKVAALQDKIWRQTKETSDTHFMDEIAAGFWIGEAYANSTVSYAYRTAGAIAK